MGDGSRPNSKGKGRAFQNEDVLALDLDSAEEGSTKHGGNAFMQMQQIEQQVIQLSAAQLHCILSDF
jgi:syntaxin 5